MSESLAFTNWFLAKDNNRTVIRRMTKPINGKRKAERYPYAKFSHLKSQRELEDLVIRLNGLDPAVERIKAKLSFKHAYISPELMEDYRVNYLYQQIPTREDAQTMFRYLERNALHFFVEKLGMKNPLEWHRAQHLWAKYLLNKTEDGLEPDKLIFEPGQIMSAKVLRYTIGELNRFLKWLHIQRPDEVPPLLFVPISKAAFKEHEARRKMNGQGRISRYVKPEDYQKIINALEERQAPWRFAVYLSHDYGLRRNETMGLLHEDVRQSHVLIQRQLAGRDESGKPVFGPLKSRLPRKVPHIWFSTAKDSYALISSMQVGIVHPDTLSNVFKNLVAELNLPPYTFHDLRRTFITNAVKKGIAIEDLRLAAGHASTATTERFYLMDGRELEDDIFVPDGTA